ncbi:MAG: PIN domain-containing protein [Spirochaetales bacterium]|nr:PIN domain-containing protein [Spirochaetales bacterium]
MKKILVDSSVWISYFKDKSAHKELDGYILHNQICTNNVILSELLPFLHIKKEIKVIDLLLEVENITLRIDWEYIIKMQIQNLKNGSNKMGISDLIIIDNVIQNNLILFSEDKHFRLIKEFLNFELL